MLEGKILAKPKFEILGVHVPIQQNVARLYTTVDVAHS
jgi:hypothetical protein